MDAASFQAPKGFAAGSYLTIFGTSLAESYDIVHTPYLPVSLAGVSVSFDNTAANIHVPGRLYFTSAGQISAQIPWEIASVSSAVIKITLSNSSSRSVRADDIGLGTYQTQTVTIPIASYSPAFFEYTDGGGARQAAALDENYAVVGTANPAQRGHIVQFYLNGLGAVTGTPRSGDPSPGTALATTLATPVVMIGGQTAPVQFSGLAPNLVGLYQVNVVVPPIAGSGLLPVLLTIGGVPAPATQIAVQ